jgi:hypothetical protein
MRVSGSSTFQLEVCKFSFYLFIFNLWVHKKFMQYLYYKTFFFFIFVSIEIELESMFILLSIYSLLFQKEKGP